MLIFTQLNFIPDCSNVLPYLINDAVQHPELEILYFTVKVTTVILCVDFVCGFGYGFMAGYTAKTTALVDLAELKRYAEIKQRPEVNIPDASLVQVKNDYLTRLYLDCLSMNPPKNPPKYLSINLSEFTDKFLLSDFTLSEVDVPAFLDMGTVFYVCANLLFSLFLIALLFRIGSKVSCKNIINCIRKLVNVISAEFKTLLNMFVATCLGKAYITLNTVLVRFDVLIMFVNVQNLQIICFMVWYMLRRMFSVFIVVSC